MPTHAPPVLRPAAGLHGSGSASCKTNARGARAALSSALARLLEEAHCISHAASCFEAAALVRLVLGSWGNTTRGAVRNKERWKARRTPIQDPSTDLASFAAACALLLQADTEKLAAKWKDTLGCALVHVGGAAAADGVTVHTHPL